MYVICFTCSRLNLTTDAQKYIWLLSEDRWTVKRWLVPGNLKCMLRSRVSIYEVSDSSCRGAPHRGYMLCTEVGHALAMLLRNMRPCSRLLPQYRCSSRICWAAPEAQWCKESHRASPCKASWLVPVIDFRIDANCPIWESVCRMLCSLLWRQICLRLSMVILLFQPSQKSSSSRQGHLKL